MQIFNTCHRFLVHLGSTLSPNEGQSLTNSENNFSETVSSQPSKRYTIPSKKWHESDQAYVARATNDLCQQIVPDMDALIKDIERMQVEHDIFTKQVFDDLDRKLRELKEKSNKI